MADEAPEFCGFSCPYSDFPPADSAGLCRTMAAVYCGKLGALVDKNAPCRWRQTRPGGQKGSAAGRSRRSR